MPLHLEGAPPLGIPVRGAEGGVLGKATSSPPLSPPTHPATPPLCAPAAPAQHLILTPRLKQGHLAGVRAPCRSNRLRSKFRGLGVSPAGWRSPSLLPASEFGTLVLPWAKGCGGAPGALLASGASTSHWDTAQYPDLTQAGQHVPSEPSPAPAVPKCPWASPGASLSTPVPRELASG